MDKPSAKMSKPAVKKAGANTAMVNPPISTQVKKPNTHVTIKRKHPFKKTKSVKPAGSQ
jgi:hypothetical protein